VSDIFTEVDEEVRREQLAQLWKKYGNLIIAAFCLVIAGVAGWRGYDYWQGVKAGEAGAAYDAAAKLAEDGKHSEAEAAFARLAADGTAGYRALAQLREANEIASRDAKAGVAAYDKIAAALSGQPLFSELAAVRAAVLLVDTAGYDEMTRRLERLAQPSGAFRHTARELLALSAWRNGDSAASRRWVEASRADPETPSGVRSRIEVLATLLPESGRTAAAMPPAAATAPAAATPPAAATADPAKPEPAKPEPPKPAPVTPDPAKPAGEP
jgi:hypothetical protein